MSESRESPMEGRGPKVENHNPERSEKARMNIEAGLRFGKKIVEFDALSPEEKDRQRKATGRLPYDQKSAFEDWEKLTIEKRAELKAGADPEARMLIEGWEKLKEEEKIALTWDELSGFKIEEEGVTKTAVDVVKGIVAVAENALEGKEAGQDAFKSYDLLVKMMDSDGAEGKKTPGREIFVTQFLGGGDEQFGLEQYGIIKGAVEKSRGEGVAGGADRAAVNELVESLLSEGYGTGDESVGGGVPESSVGEAVGESGGVPSIPPEAAASGGGAYDREKRRKAILARERRERLGAFLRKSGYSSLTLLEMIAILYLISMAEVAAQIEGNSERARAGRL